MQGGTLAGRRLLRIQAFCAAGPGRWPARRKLFLESFIQRTCTPLVRRDPLVQASPFSSRESKGICTMNHAPAINIWKGTNRVSRLWDDLLTDLVSPDAPARGESSLGENLERFFLLETLEREVDPPATGSRQKEPAGPSLLEKAGFESLRLIRQALETLTAPPEQEPAIDSVWVQPLQNLPASHGDLEQRAIHDPIQEASALGLTFIKVSSEPEPQPGSSIDTRCIANGLKIPRRPLHKRPVYQRVFFCLRHMMSRGREKLSPR
jgi:hypothetical protein